MKVNLDQASVVILSFLNEVQPDFIAEGIDYNRIVVPQQQAWGVYKIRYNILLENNTIVGKELYERTLDELSKFDEEMVSIHTFNFKGEKLVLIFADQADCKVIGHILY